MTKKFVVKNCTITVYCVLRGMANITTAEHLAVTQPVVVLSAVLTQPLQRPLPLPPPGEEPPRTLPGTMP